MEEPEAKSVPKNSTLVRSTSRRSTPGRSTPGRSTSGRSISSVSTPGRSTSGKSPSGRSISGKSISGRSTPGRSTPDRSTTPEPPRVPPATYHWEEVRRKRSVGGYPWTHLDKPPFDEKTWVKYERDHVYEPVTPAASTDRISSPAAKPPTTTGPPKDESRHFLRIPLTEELVMADDETESEQEDSAEPRRRSDGGNVGGDHHDDEADCDDEDEDDDAEKKSDESIYEGENENSSAGAGDAGASNTRMKAFQQKVKVKADILRTKLQGVTKRKPKQKIVVDAATNGEKSRRKFGQFATLPKKFTFNAAKVNFSTAFGGFAKNQTAAVDGESGEDRENEAKSGDGGGGSGGGGGGRFSLPRFGFTRTSSESPKPSKSTWLGASRLSIPGFRPRAGSDASRASSKPDDVPKSRIMDFGTYPRIFSKRRKTNAENQAKTPPPQSQSQPSSNGGANATESSNFSSSINKHKDSFRRRFFRTHKESTPGPTAREQTAALAVEEELDETHATSKESLAEFGDSDLQEVISLTDDCGRSNKDTKSLCSEHRPGVIEEIDSDEFFLREKGLSRGDVHISNYLSSEIRDVFRRSNRTRSVEGVNNHHGNSHGGSNRNSNSHESNDDGGGGTATPVRPSRTNSLRRPATRAQNFAVDADRFSTMPKSFGGSSRPLFGKLRPEDEDVATPENIITSQTFEPSSSSRNNTFSVPWRTARKQEDTVVTHMPPKPPTRHQRMTKFSTFDTRSMIDLSRKRSQSQIGFLPSMNFSETVPKAPLRRSRTSLAGSDRDVSVTSDSRPSWVPTPPLRRSRMSLAAADLDAEDRSAATPTTVAAAVSAKARTTPPRPPPPQVQQQQQQTAGYATVDKTASLLVPQSPARHRRKKSYDVIKSQEFGAFFTIPRSYSYGSRNASATLLRDVHVSSSSSTAAATDNKHNTQLPPPSRPARAYNTLGPSRPHRRRLPFREHEYGDVADDIEDDGRRQPELQQKLSSSLSSVAQGRSASLDDPDGPAKVLCSGDVIEKMKLRPLPSPPPPPRKSKTDTPESPHCTPRRNTDSAVAPFLDPRETSATSSDDFFADVSRALETTAAAAAAANDDVSVGIQTDPLPDGYELDDVGSCCSAESDRPASRASSCTSAAARADHDRPTSSTSTTGATATAAASLHTMDRPTSRTSTTTEYVDRPSSRMSTNAIENGYVMMPADKLVSGGGGVICAQRISVNELQVGKMIVADIRGQRMGVENVSGSNLKIAHLAAGVMAPSLEAAVATATAAVLPSSRNDDHDDDLQHRHHHQQDDNVSVQSSRVSSMYPEVDSDEDRTSVLAAPTPPRRRSRPTTTTSAASITARLQSSNSRTSCSAVGTAVDLSPGSAAAVDPSITELSCQLFRLCHSNVCSLFNKVVQQVVPEDTEKRRDLQAALCFLSIILAGLLILGFGNEKTIHHHHWDFQFPPPNQ